MTTLLELSVSGGVFILAVILARALTIRRLPKAAFLALWGAALLQLTLPVRVPSPVSIYTAAQRLGAEALPRRSGLLLSAAAEGGVEASVRDPRFSPWPALWLAGALALAAVFLILHLRSRRGYRESLPVENGFVEAWQERHRLRRAVRVRSFDRIQSPLTYGVFRPVILLPKAVLAADERTLSFVLAHETVHIRRFDVLAKWLLAAALCVHWFNPLVWVMYLLANRDLELSCDESVLREYGLQARSSYAMALVELEERRAHLTPLASSFSVSALRGRLAAIMQSRPATKARVLLSTALVMILLGVFATSASFGAAGRPEEAPESSWKGASFGVTEWEPDYTEEDHQRLMAALRAEGYPDRSIAEFNRTVYGALSGEEKTNRDIGELYERALMTLEDSDPDAAFLRNTVQASMAEYNARLREVHTGERTDPEFYGSAENYPDQYTDDWSGGGWVGYRFTYRILDQDRLTVRERDAFLQSMMQAAQDILEKAEAKDKGKFEAALGQAGEALSNEEIQFTGCQVTELGYDWEE